MKKNLIASAITALLSLSGCDSNQNKQTTSSAPQQASTDNQQGKYQQKLQELYQQSVQTLFQKRELSATLYGLPEQDVGIYYADKLEDYNPKVDAKLRHSLLELSEKILNVPLINGSQQDKDTQLVMANITRYFAGDPNFSIGYIDTWMGLSPFIVNQINGPLIDTPRYMQSDQKITNEKEANDYLSRLAQYDKFITSVENKLAFDTKQNWLPPKVIVEGAIRYLTNFTQAPAAEHPLVTAFVEKVNKIDELSQDKKKALIDSAKQKVAEVVYPAYQTIAKKMTQLLPKARTEAGIWAQPNGTAYYQDAIQQLGDSNLTPDQIHQIGLNEVNRINQQMDKILKAQGYTQGTVGERMVALNNEERFLYPDSDEGRAQLLNDLNGYIAEINEKMAPLFQSKPSYQVEVRAFPVEVQDGAPGGQYTPPSVDGSKPGIYWINLRDMKANPKFGLKTLTYHEANPGHHWQVALNMEQAELPFLRRIAPYNAYIEGWALYSEKVAAELGLYKDDPFGDLGRLQAEIFRAVRLVVDTGIHAKQWTREQAIEYMAEQTGSARSDVIAEIERYMAWPGQALGYKLGMLKILSLREHAQKILGDKFDLAAFHDLILLGGAVPMAVLEQRVNSWIKQQQ